MNQSTRKRLEAIGARVTNVQEFLDLTDPDTAFIEMKIALAKLLRERRKSAELTQEQAAKLLGSSQSRVAKMEAGDPAVSMDLLVGSLLKLGESPHVVGERLGAVRPSVSSPAATMAGSRGAERRAAQAKAKGPSALRGLRPSRSTA
ncbi:MAG TPA: helix-turn-helix domain-containing protein [Thermoanaerobaculia bacterium]|nr:helix-turn-helix domain-containing protein [Thermoanaerobaculia bacterium]